jgi:hypothetical protein
MSHGLFIENDSGKLVFSSEGMLFGYLGKAVLSSTTAPTTEASGFSTLTFEHNAPIIAAVKLTTNHFSILLSMTRSGSTWTIVVHHGNALSTNAQGFQNQVTPDVYVWGLPVSVSGYGVALYSAAGVLTADLSRRPLTIAQKLDWSNVTVTEAIGGGIVTPAIVGPLHDWQRIRSGAGPTYDFNYDSGMWGRTATDIERAWVQRAQQLGEDTGDPTITARRAARGIVVDVNGLT